MILIPSNYTKFKLVDEKGQIPGNWYETVLTYWNTNLSTFSSVFRPHQ